MTLRAKIALVLVGTIFGLLVIATLLRAIEDHRTFLEQQTAHGVALAQTLAELIAREGGTADPGRAQRIVTEFSTTSGVVSARIVDHDFRLVASSRAGQAGRPYRDPDVVEAVRYGIPTTEIKRTSGPPVLDVAVPIRMDGRLVGAVELQTVLGAPQTDLVQFIRRGALAAALVGGITTLLLLWSLTLVVVRPVTRFASLTQDLARGDFAVEFPQGGEDEIGQLGRALAKTQDSLRKLSALWKDQNPLSGLPGNLAIERELRHRLESGQAFTVLYADLDAFKAFNDRYGFDRGDEVLKFTAQVLQAALQAHGGAEDFLGHIGGDDFVLALDPAHTAAVAGDAIQRFDAGAGQFYDIDDRARGHILARNRQGEVSRVPIATLTVVGVPVAARLTNVLSIGEAAAELKAHAKRRPGSKFLMDHRTVP